jgi:hypothetical protein
MIKWKMVLEIPLFSKNADFVEITIDGVDFPSSTITSDVSVY